jgi:hypothetical protein
VGFGIGADDNLRRSLAWREETTMQAVAPRNDDAQRLGTSGVKLRQR